MENPRLDVSTRRRLTTAAFAAFLVLGCLASADYGLNWDEHFVRVDNGEACWRLLTQFDRRPISRSAERYHGPALEIPLFALERLLGLDDTRPIYLVRHAVLFLLFFAACVVFYKLLRRTYPERTVAVVGTLFLVLSPRLFGDACHNSKDLGFLCCYVFGMATMTWFLRSPSSRSAVGHGLACGVLVDVRLVGVVLPALTVALALTLWLAERLAPRGESDREPPTPLPVRPLLAFVGWTAVFVLAFWPMLWLNPPLHLMRAWREMRSYPWQGTVRYAGDVIPASRLPWHYLPVWILLTTPLAYVAFFTLGCGRLLVAALRQPVAFLRRHLEEVAIALAGFLPLAAVVGLKATVYDGWRHLFFVYPGLACVAAGGFAVLLRGCRQLRGRLFVAPASVCAIVATLTFLPVAWVMVRDHPHQNVYFNALAGSSLESIKSRFEVDYWGLSCRQALEGLLRAVPEGELRVVVDTWPGHYNACLLPASQRSRLRFVPHAEADYLLTHFRTASPVLPEPPGVEVFAVRVRDAAIAAVYRIR